MPGVVRHLHLDQNVAGKEFALDFALLAALHLDERLGRDLHLAELLSHSEGFDTLSQILPDPLLESRVGMDDEPLLSTHIDHQLTVPRDKTKLTARKNS
jgi:hypothetical protein